MRKNNLITRLKLSWYVFSKASRDVRLMSCGKCGGINIKEIPNTERNLIKRVNEDVTYTWSDKVKCKNCGAECNEIQTWEWED